MPARAVSGRGQRLDRAHDRAGAEGPGADEREPNGQADDRQVTGEEALSLRIHHVDGNADQRGERVRLAALMQGSEGVETYDPIRAGGLDDPFAPRGDRRSEPVRQRRANRMCRARLARDDDPPPVDEGQHRAEGQRGLVRRLTE